MTDPGEIPVIKTACVGELMLSRMPGNAVKVGGVLVKGAIVPEDELVITGVVLVTTGVLFVTTGVVLVTVVVFVVTGTPSEADGI